MCFALWKSIFMQKCNISCVKLTIPKYLSFFQSHSFFINTLLLFLLLMYYLLMSTFKDVKYILFGCAPVATKSTGPSFSFHSSECSFFCSPYTRLKWKDGLTLICWSSCKFEIFVQMLLNSLFILTIFVVYLPVINIYLPLIYHLFWSVPGQNSKIYCPRVDFALLVWACIFLLVVVWFHSWMVSLVPRQ